MLNIAVILGSTRPNRFSEKALPWLKEGLSKEENLNVEFFDLRDYQLPHYDQGVTPSQVTDGAYGNAVAKEWATKIKAADAFIVVTPEYNHGYSAVLKDALDAVYSEWNNKPIAFVSYGSVGGARAVEQLRLVAVELQMTPIRSAVHIQAPWMLLAQDGTLPSGALDAYTPALQNTIKQLRWWGDALKVARENTK